ncbi:hypothetical protein BaRGS_00019127 [Batillaria attramentaria]|uniref:Serine/threonine-protein kinase Nek4 n=1 Tax=Batillaria attramentaria TaxID=370345 RepID=A0ABD0KSK8_9CAEN
MPLSLIMEHLPKLMEHLKNHLPETLPIYYTADNAVRGNVSLQEVHFVVDSWPEPSGVLLVSPSHQGQLFNYRTTVDVWVKDTNCVKELLFDTDLLDWKKPIFFRVLGSRGLDHVQKLLAEKSDAVDCVERQIYVLDSPTPPLQAPPAGYTQHSLTPKEAETVGLQYSAWGVTPSDTVCYFQACASRLRSSGVCTADGELVSYVVLHHTNAFGSVFTDPRHRRKGLGELVVVDVCRKMSEDGQTPFVFGRQCHFVGNTKYSKSAMDDFERLRVIGKGSYGEVWLAKHKKDKKQYVLKRMNLQRASKRERTSAEQEAKLLSKLKHPNIVSYKDSFETKDGMLYIAMQYCEGGDLYTRLKEQKAGQALEERQVVEWFVQIAMALQSDVWALGCCVYEMTTLKHAFNAKDMNSLVYKILKGKTPPMPRQYSSELQDLMKQMLDQNPDRRPSVNRLLRNPYIKRNIAIFLEDTKRGDVTDSVPEPQRTDAAGDAPPYKPGHARRPSNSAPKELEPIQEHAAQKDKVSEDSLSSKEDTVVPNTVKEVKEEKAAAKPDEGKRKKKKKLVPSRPAANSQAETRDAETDALSARSDVSTASKQSKEPNSARPLPVPKVEKSEGLPQKRDALVQQEKVRQGEKSRTDSASSKSSSMSDGLAEDTPRNLPNLSARERRREKHTASSSMEQPNSARVRLRRIPERSASEKVTRKEKTPPPDENTKEREKRRENKEMNNFISILDNTLKMNCDIDKSDEELTEVPVDSKPRLNGRRREDKRRASVEKESKPADEPEKIVEEAAPAMHKSASMPSVETLTSTSRDCFDGLGYEIVKKAYEILDRIEEDAVEPQLMELLGKERFDEYAGKIWQLKFCEESYFMS